MNEEIFHVVTVDASAPIDSKLKDGEKIIPNFTGSPEVVTKNYNVNVHPSAMPVTLVGSKAAESTTYMVETEAELIEYLKTFKGIIYQILHQPLNGKYAIRYYTIDNKMIQLSPLGQKVYKFQLYVLAKKWKFCNKIIKYIVDLFVKTI